MQAKALKFWKDFSDAAKEMAVYGLTNASQALDRTASRLKATADKLTAPKSDKDEGADAPAKQ